MKGKIWRIVRGALPDGAAAAARALGQRNPVVAQLLLVVAAAVAALPEPEDRP